MRCADNQISNNQTGFSLIEVLIAVCVLTLGILAANVMQITAISGNSTANRITESTSWASDRVESVLGLEYDDAAFNDGDADGDLGLTHTGANADGSLTSPDGNYTIYWNVSEDSPFIGVKTINVIITTLELGATKSVSMTYIKADSV